MAITTPKSGIQSTLARHGIIHRQEPHLGNRPGQLSPHTCNPFLEKDTLGYAKIICSVIKQRITFVLIINAYS